MREHCTSKLYDIVAKDKSVIAIVSDGPDNNFLRIKEDYPAQYIDYGISENNMVASASGLASCGKIPFIYGASNFIVMRSFEFLRNDVCIANQNVKFIGIFSGLSRTTWGPTHQATEDIALLRCLPNLLMITPATPLEAEKALDFAYHHDGPVYIRLEYNGGEEYFDNSYEFVPGRGNIIRQGKDVTIVTIGAIIDEALISAEELKSAGIDTRVISLSTLKPIDTDIILDAARSTKGIITFEEHSLYGGLGSSVSEVVASEGVGCKVIKMGLPECVSGCGSRDYIRRKYRLDKDSIVLNAKKILETQE